MPSAGSVNAFYPRLPGCTTRRGCLRKQLSRPAPPASDSNITTHHNKLDAYRHQLFSRFPGLHISFARPNGGASSPAQPNTMSQPRPPRTGITPISGESHALSPRSV
ncbi:hypothetical protein PMIN06_009160 [Paraphaeosphaeria minitans]